VNIPPHGSPEPPSQPQPPYQPPTGGLPQPPAPPQPWGADPSTPAPTGYPGGYGEPTGSGFPPPGAPPGYPPPAAKRGNAKLWIIIGSAVAAVGVIIAIIFALLPTSPAGTVDKYFTAVFVDGDGATAVKLTCKAELAGSADVEQLKAEVARDAQRAKDESVKASWKTGNTEVTGDKATVEVTLTETANDANGKPDPSRTKSHTGKLTLVKEDGIWKVCSH